MGDRHTAKDLNGFLRDFHSSGAPFPEEIVCDESRALLNACVLTYSDSSNIEEYADTLVDVKKTSTRIRIDVAHFEKKYKDLLKILPPRIFTFYMASIGRLIMSQDLTEAATIVKTLFLISNCETEGKDLETGFDTECSKIKEWLRILITSKFL